AELQEMTALLKRLRYSHFLQTLPCPGSQALAGLDLQIEPSTTFQRLIETLKNSSETLWKERTFAAWTLGRAQLTPEQSAGAAKVPADVLTDRQSSKMTRYWERLSRHVSRVYLLAFGLGAPLLLLLAYQISQDPLHGFHLISRLTSALAPLLLFVVAPL